MPSEHGDSALVTGGGRGIGAGIARELAADGWSVVVAARSRDEIDAVAKEIDGRAIELDVSDREAVERASPRWATSSCWSPTPESPARTARPGRSIPTDWWHVQEINVLGVHLCCRTVIPGMLERGSGRIVITASGAAYLPARAAPPTREQGGRLPATARRLPTSCAAGSRSSSSARGS